MPEVGLGVLPGTGGTQRLARLIGKARAIELMVTGRIITFEQGQELGMVTEIYESSPDEFRDKVLAYAKQFTSPHKAPLAVGAIKRSVQSGAEIPLEYALALERELQSALFKSGDAKEGLGAYVEKRTARFRKR